MTELSSDFMDREVPVFRDDVCIFISQSGISEFHDYNLSEYPRCHNLSYTM